jgi:hypothetical protein
VPSWHARILRGTLSPSVAKPTAVTR